MEQNKLLLFKSFDEFLQWNKNNIPIVAIEITEDSEFLHKYEFPENVNIVLGSETNGLPSEILQIADAVLTIPQKGNVGSLNVSQSASIVHFAATISKPASKIVGNKFIC